MCIFWGKNLESTVNISDLFSLIRKTAAMRWVIEGKLYSGTLISERTFQNYVVPLNGTMEMGNLVRQAASALY